MSQSSLPHGLSFLPVPSALVTVCPDEECRRAFPVGWLGVVCGSPAVLTVSLHTQATKRELLRVGDLFSVDLPAEETMRSLGDQDWLDQAEGLAVTGQAPQSYPAGAGRRKPLVAVPPVRIDCRCRSLGVRFGQCWLCGDIVAVYLDGNRQKMTAAVDLSHLLPWQKRRFRRCSEGLRRLEGC